MAYTTEDKVLHRAKLQKSDVHANAETATAIISECITDAEAEINLVTSKPSGWSESNSYYASIQAAATNLTASYLCKQEGLAIAIGQASREALEQRSKELYSRAMAILDKLKKKLFIATSEE